MNQNLSFQFVNHLWNQTEAGKFDPVGKLVYRSNLLGADQRITNTGGGNTSSKITERDPLTGQPVEVLWVKGSGGDLRTSKKENFASLYQEKLLGLQPVYSKVEKRGPKTEIEDAMVGMYPHCTFNLNPRAASIDTPLHAFIPYKHVDHMHPNAVIAIAAAKNARKLTQEIYGDELVWTPWQRPGFDLGLKLQEICRQYPHSKGVILGQHGLINWANDERGCYELTLHLIERAAQYIEQHDKGEKTFGGAKYRALAPAQRHEMFVQILPWLRGQVSQQRRFVGTIQDDEAMLQFVNGVDAPRLAELGTSCPDHFLRTKIKPLYVNWNPQSATLADLKSKLTAGLAKYRQDYADYYNRCKHSDSPAMRDPNPTVILIPGLGMIAWGRIKVNRASRQNFMIARSKSYVVQRQLTSTSPCRNKRRSILNIGCSKKPNCAGCHRRRNGPANHRRCWRRQRHRQGSRAPARQGRRACRERRHQRRSREGDGKRDHG
jgi:rhamnulose-1-phosphate aldolase/alcohol dehydrogenase